MQDENESLTDRVVPSGRNQVSGHFLDLVEEEIKSVSCQVHGVLVCLQ